MTTDPIQTVLTDLATENLNLRIMLAQANARLEALAEAQNAPDAEAQDAPDSDQPKE